MGNWSLDIFQGQAHPHFLFLFSFLPHPADGHAALFLPVCGFPAQPLHLSSRIDRAELPGVAL